MIDRRSSWSSWISATASGITTPFEHELGRAARGSWCRPGVKSSASGPARRRRRRALRRGIALPWIRNRRIIMTRCGPWGCLGRRRTARPQPAPPGGRPRPGVLLFGDTLDAQDDRLLELEVEVGRGLRWQGVRDVLIRRAGFDLLGCQRGQTRVFLFLLERRDRGQRKGAGSTLLAGVPQTVHPDGGRGDLAERH